MALNPHPTALRRNTSWRLARLLLASILLGACATSPGHPGPASHGDLRLDSESVARARYAGLLRGTTATTLAVGSTLVLATPVVLAVFHQNRDKVAELQERLAECARMAEHQVNSTHFGNRPPTREECGEELDVDGCGEPITRAMFLGQAEARPRPRLRSRRPHPAVAQALQHRAALPLLPGQQNCRDHQPREGAPAHPRWMYQGPAEQHQTRHRPPLGLQSPPGRDHHRPQVSLPSLQRSDLAVVWQHECLWWFDTRTGLSGRVGWSGFPPHAARILLMKEHIPHIRMRADNGFLVARDGLILCFFMRRSHEDVAPIVWRSLQTYLQAIPPGALSWYVASEGGLLPLDSESWEDIRQDMLERSCPVSRIVDLQEHSDQMGSYNFEYYGRRLDAPVFARDENSTCAVSFTLPTAYLMEHGPARVRALALELARELPFSFGYASPALLTTHFWWYQNHRAVRELRDRYPGLDIYNLEETSRRLGTRARGVYWLTFLGQPLLGQLGGLESLRQRLPFPDISFQSLDDERALLTLNEWPEAIDTQQEPIPPQFTALARLLEPFMYEQEVTGWFFHDDKEGMEDMRRWIRRFCP